MVLRSCDVLSDEQLQTGVGEAPMTCWACRRQGRRLGCLLGSSHGGVSDEGALVLPNGLSPLLRAFLDQQIPPA